MTLTPLSKMSALEESVQLDSWRVFDLTGVTGEIHTVPVYKNGVMRLGHKFVAYCDCDPMCSDVGPSVMVTHNDVFDV